MDPRSTRLDPKRADFALGGVDIRSAALAEALDRENRFKVARSSRSLGPRTQCLTVQRDDMPRNHGSNIQAITERIEARQDRRERLEGIFIVRTPCTRCGVRYDIHDDLGCKRWVG